MEKIKVIYEDSEMLVLDKPAGLITTREGKEGGKGYIEDWVGQNYPNSLPRKGIVHRLDRGTSGVLLVAKDGMSLVRLKNLFKKKEVEKVYLALVGADLPSEGMIRVPVGRLRGLGRFGVVIGGKEAKTLFEVAAKYQIDGRIFSLLRLYPKTGRTHQIRVHLRYLGWPIVGDEKYGGLRVLGLNRPFLHAARLRVEGKEFKSELPGDLEGILDRGEKIS